MSALHKQIKWVLVIILLLAGLVGIFRMGGLEIAQSMAKEDSSVKALSTGWKYTVNGEKSDVDITLPAVLPLESNARIVTLQRTLPDDIKSGDVLRLQTLSGWFNIYIDGELRIEYGNPRITDSYWYENASAMLLVKLSEPDSGKSIVIETGSIDAHHLALQRAPLIGTHRDFIIGDIIESTYGNILITTMVVSCVLLLLIWVFFLLRRQNIRQIPRGVIFLLMLTAYYNGSNIFLIEVTGYAPTYFGLNDFIYYVMNVLIPIVGYRIVLPTVKEGKNHWLKCFIIAHVLVVIIAFIVQVETVENYEPIEKLLMVMTTVGYTWMLILTRKQPLVGAEKWVVYPVFVCILAYILDYCKYMLNLDWLPEALVNYLQVDSPFMIFLPVGMMIYLPMLIVSIVHIITERQTAYAMETKSAELRASLAEKEFYTAMENMNQIRRIRHDIEHHLTVVDGYLTEDRPEDAKEYIESVIKLIPKGALSDKNFVTGSFVQQYRSICQQNHIEFSEDIVFDEGKIADKAALGIILGNGLKNAVEAAMEAEGKRRFVRISGKQVHDNIAIIIENGFDHEIADEFNSTKGKGRGMGLSNIRDAACSCGGYAEWVYSKSTFTLEVVLVI